MIGVSDLQYSYSKVTTASAGGLNFSRFNLPRSSRVECLGEARWAPSQDPLRPRAHWDPRGWNARRPRRRRPAPTGPGTELAWQRPRRRVVRCSHALQLRAPREPPGLGRWRHTERRGRAPVLRWALAHPDAALRPMCRPVADVPLHVLARGPLRDRRDRVPWRLG